MESSIIATALCSAAGNLRPLDGYKRLRELGGNQSRLSPELRDLVRNTDDPSADQGDSAALFERKKMAIEWFDKQLEKFDTALAEQMVTKDVYEFPTVWEIQDDVRNALATLRGLVSRLEVAESSVPRGPFGKK